MGPEILTKDRNQKFIATDAAETFDNTSYAAMIETEQKDGKLLNIIRLHVMGQELTSH